MHLQRAPAPRHRPITITAFPPTPASLAAETKAEVPAEETEQVSEPDMAGTLH